MKQFRKVTFVFLLGVISWSGWGQTISYTLQLKMNAHSAASWKHRHESNYGLAVTTSASWTGKKVRLEVHTTESINFPVLYECNETTPISRNAPIFIYGAYTDSNTASVTRKWDNLYRYIDWGWFSRWNESCDIYRPYSYDYYGHMALAADDKVHHRSPGSPFPARHHGVNVDIRLTVPDGISLADIKKVKIPGVQELSGADFKDIPLTELRQVLENPGAFPNYVMLAAHRGYWMYAPENSLEAFKNGIDVGADMVEIDLKMTADNQIMVAHDFHLGRLTTLPSALQNSAFVDGGYYKFGKMKFCDLRPDLCPGGPGYDASNPNNCDTCTPTAGVNNTVPVRLVRPNGQSAEKLPTLREAFDFLNEYPVLIDLDKIDPGNGLPDNRFPGSPVQVKTYFFDSLYKVANEKNILDQIIVKQRIDKFTPADLTASTVVDWSKWYFTPTAFSDANTANCGGSLQNCLNGYFDSPQINCPGVEYIYLEDNDPVFQGVYYYIRTTKNNRVFQFPAYPENGAGVWNPKPILFSDIDPSQDRRNDWDWLLQPERRPDVIISDRFEVLKELLEELGMRQK